jgi:hypothetical protein
MSPYERPFIEPTRNQVRTSSRTRRYLPDQSASTIHIRASRTDPSAKCDSPVQLSPRRFEVTAWQRPRKSSSPTVFQAQPGCCGAHLAF